MPRTTQHDPNAVPISAIRPLIQEWLRKHSADRATGLGGDRDPYLAGERLPNGAYDILGFQCGVNGRQLRGYVTGTPTKGSNSEYVSFDTADKIVCATAGPIAWHTDKRLKPYYGPLAVLRYEALQGFELPEGVSEMDLTPEQRHYWRRAREEVAA